MPDETSVVTTKVASGSGGFTPGTLIESTTRVLGISETKSFLSRVDNLGFWTAPNPVNDQTGTDGSQWIIEGVKNGKYHVVDRWMPKGGVAHDLGVILAFDLAKMQMSKTEVY
jgi:hypothetical protein